MSDLSVKETILLALIQAGHHKAQDYAFDMVAGVNTTFVATSSDSAGVATPTADSNLGEIISDALDNRGFPWCSRIHAKTKTTDAKGNWKYAVGIDRETLVPAVEQELREQGYGQPLAATAPTTPAAPPVAAPTPAAPPVAAPAPGLPPVAAPIPGLPPVAAPVKVDFPEVAGEDDMDDNALTTTAAALASKHGNDALKKLLTLFGVAEGGTAHDIQAGYKYTFWQYATSDEGLRQQSVIS